MTSAADDMLARYIILIVTALLGSCGADDERLPEFTLSGNAMGTQYAVNLVAPGDDIDREKLGALLTDTLRAIDDRMSTYKPGSELSRFNASPGIDWVPASAELCTVIDNALDISALTGGAFDVTVGPLVNLWGFGPDGDRSAPPDDDSIAAAQRRVGYDALQADCDVPALRKGRPDIYVDLSAYAKGYAVDRLAEVLDQHGALNYLVEIGGELRMRGHNAKGGNWAIAVEKPAEHSRLVQTIVHLSDNAMATSGDYRNYFESGGRRYSHTIDPRSGRPVTHNVASVTVIHPRAATADALATALLVMGPADGPGFANEHGLAAYFLVRGETAIEEQMTAAFSAMVKK